LTSFASIHRDLRTNSTQFQTISETKILHRKNEFAEKSKILLDIDQKIILLDYQNHFVRILKIMSNVANNFDILATSLSILHNYFDSLTKLLF